MTGSRDAEASNALVHFLLAPETAKVFKAKGLDPG
jgi:hypothetical protein